MALHVEGTFDRQFFDGYNDQRADLQLPFDYQPGKDCEPQTRSD